MLSSTVALQAELKGDQEQTQKLQEEFQEQDQKLLDDLSFAGIPALILYLAKNLAKGTEKLQLKLSGQPNSSKTKTYVNWLAQSGNWAEILLLVAPKVTEPYGYDFDYDARIQYDASPQDLGTGDEQNEFEFSTRETTETLRGAGVLAWNSEAFDQTFENDAKLKLGLILRLAQDYARCALKVAGARPTTDG